MRARECEDVLDVRWQVPEIPKSLEKDEQGQNEEGEDRLRHQKCGDGVLGSEILEGDRSNFGVVVEGLFHVRFLVLQGRCR